MRRVRRRLPLLATLVPGVLAAQQDVTFSASDGGRVHGSWFSGTREAVAVVVAFHQGGASGEGEYGPIVPRLNEAGYDVLVVDQRAGGDRFGGTNRTVLARGRSADYCEAAADLDGALAHAREERPDLPIILWGSSYSGALVLRLAATGPDGVAGVLAFSPASGGPMTECRGEDVSGGISVPVLALRPRSELDIESAARQFAVLRGQGHRTFVADPGTHGSSMLVEDRVGGPVDASWDVVLQFIRDAVEDASSSPR